MVSIRKRLNDALEGRETRHPVYAVYDWFVQHRKIDWNALFVQGLGQLNHADMSDVERPNLKIEESVSEYNGQPRRDVRWITDAGELHEWYLGEWRQEHLIKQPDDYRILKRALEGSRFTMNPEPFNASEQAVGEGGMTVGHIWRTPLQEVQIDYVGLERFSFHLADEEPELMELLELMADLKEEECRVVASHPAKYIKLWENLSIQTMGPGYYRRFICPVYDRILKAFDGTGKRIMVHYDGQLRAIAGDFAKYPFDVDSLTPAPEGDMAMAECRAVWPEKFFWLHPTLSWFKMEPERMLNNIRQMMNDVGNRRFCLMISEDVPPEWETRVPMILEMLSGR